MLTKEQHRHMLTLRLAKLLNVEVLFANSTDTKFWCVNKTTKEYMLVTLTRGDYIVEYFCSVQEFNTNLKESI